MGGGGDPGNVVASTEAEDFVVPSSMKPLLPTLSPQALWRCEGLMVIRLRPCMK